MWRNTQLSETRSTAVQEIGNTKFSICLSAPTRIKFVEIVVEILNFECAKFSWDKLNSKQYKAFFYGSYKLLEF